MKEEILVGFLVSSWGVSNFWALDVNQDGASDVWQRQYAISTAQLILDNDGDGMLNLNEAQSGTNPNLGSSLIRPTIALVAINNVQIK